MSYTSGLNQRFRSNTLYNNYTAEDVEITNTNLGLIANLKYVQNWMSSVLTNYMTILNPVFSGSMTSSTGGNIAVSSLTVPTITSNTNFTGSPTISNIPIEVNVVGEIMISISNTPPPNFILCNGQALSSLQYQKLYSLIGTTYGGSGGMFNLPDFSSYFPLGANGVDSLASSNLATGNGQIGANNNYQYTSNFAGGSPQTAPLLHSVPSHSHNIDDPGHPHILPNLIDDPFYIPEGDFSIPLPSSKVDPLLAPLQSFTELATTGIVVFDFGVSIQAGDTVSGLNGVNISPPYVGVFYFICANSN